MKVAWIGLGTMGRPMVRNLSSQGWEVSAYDVSESARRRSAADGVPVAETAAEATRHADVVFTMLPTGEHVRQAVLGSDAVLAEVSTSAIVVDCSTVGTLDAQSLGKDVAARGLSFVDAPVSGAAQGAEAGTLTFMTGGAAHLVDTIEPLLTAMGSRTIRVGPNAGDGQCAKVVNNMLVGVHVAALCEAVVLADRLGVDQKVLKAVIAASSGSSWALENYHPLPGIAASSPASRGYAPGFATALMSKDLGLALSAGEATRTRLSLAGAAADLYRESAEHGNSANDCSSLVKILIEHRLEATSS
jgi:3-hydroxyisobutyrate dehydrogenase